jgi:small-conductance mechanosensitive channel
VKEGTAVARFVLPLLLLTATTALLWAAHGYASAHRLFGSAAFSSVFLAGALFSSALLFVSATSQLVLRLGFAWLLRNEPTQLQRALIVAVLTFIAAAVSLWYSGLDLSTILTTSALLSAIVGLSVQPMLGSLMSGLAMHGLVRPGDGVVLDGEPVAITSLNWRSVVGRRTNGSRVIMPNARLADGTLQVLAHDRPVRAEVKLDMPTWMAPHRVRKLVSELVAEFGEVDATQPIVVLPSAYDASKPLAGYRVEFWVRHYADRAAVEGRVLRRFWYAFQREGIVPVSDGAPQAQRDVERSSHLDIVMAALQGEGGTLVATAETESLARSLMAAGETLRYDDGERIVLPERLADCMCVLLDGAVSEIAPGEEHARPSIGSARTGQQLTRATSLSLIEQALARRIGPYAAHAVEQASADGASLPEVCAMVAHEIDDNADRQAFMREACPSAQRTRGPGLLFRAALDSAQRLVAMPPTRAVDHALVLAVPESALPAGGLGVVGQHEQRGKTRHAAAARTA